MAPQGDLGDPAGDEITEHAARHGAHALRLAPTWDASLTYDVLRGSGKPKADVVTTAKLVRGATRAGPIFVGRAELVGSLVNAISQPDGRGTYLISGYRGAGKTSLVIEAARQAREQLPKDRRLLPLVLNVSEVSASLDAGVAGAPQPPLGIDTKRLLTALLRALRNALDAEARPAVRARGPRAWGRVEPAADELDRSRALVSLAYDKAHAAQYVRRAQRGTQRRRSDARTSKLSITVANVMKLVSTMFALAALAVGGVVIAETATSALLVICAALAGVSAAAFRTSRTMTSESSERSSHDTEIAFDNSMHQVESDLKTILDELHAAGMRTMFVLEELDKVNDPRGRQLGSVIRYFKNLFTQAPALFFFLTDKDYFDVVERELAAARQTSTYAVEHTFFTHRVFVSRPSLHECLDYLDEVVDDADARMAIEAIRACEADRSRSLLQMSPIERFLRVLLFTSNNHLFDLKNEMRRYVLVSDAGSHLAFDEASFPPREQGLAVFHFLLEQKLQLYWFGAGRDYANEILRNCLSGVLADIGADDARPIAGLYCDGAGQSNLRRDDRRIIREAVDSLLEDLAGGGAITLADEPGAAADRPQPAFRWLENAVASFSPSPKLEIHEEMLRTQLERTVRISRQFGTDGPLARRLGGVELGDLPAATYERAAEQLKSASRPITREAAEQLSGASVRDLRGLLADARGSHQSRLSAAGWVLSARGRSRRLGTHISFAGTAHDTGPSRVLLVYGADEIEPSTVRQMIDELGPVPVAAVIVDDDPRAPQASRHALLARWRELLNTNAPVPPLVSIVPLGEGLSAGTVEGRWGERTTDELVFARMWIVQAERYRSGDARIAWLGDRSEEHRFEALEHALGAWLAAPDSLLGAPPGAGNDANELAATVARLAATTDDIPVLVRLGQSANQLLTKAPNRAPTTSIKGDPEKRLHDRGRLIWLHRVPRTDARSPAILVGPNAPAAFAGAVKTLRVADDAPAFGAVAAFLDPFDPDRATAAYQEAAERGDPEAMGRLIVRHTRSGGDDEPSPKLVERLVATREWKVVVEAGLELLDTFVGVRLLTAAAEAGFAQAMGVLLIASATRPDIDVERWQAQLIGSGDGVATGSAARGLEFHDPQRAQQLRLAAAELGDPTSSFELLVSTGSDERTVQANLDRLRQQGEWRRLAQARQEVAVSSPSLADAIGRILDEQERTSPALEGSAET